MPPTLKNHLSSLTKEKLINHILNLDKKFKQVKEYHQFMVVPNEGIAVEKFKKVIENEFFPTRGLPKMRLSVARSAITDAGKMNLSAKSKVDLMLYYVETGVRFTNEFGDLNEQFYNSMESMFLSALKHMQKEDLLSEFKDRAHSIVEETYDIGWGFHDTLGDYFFTYFPD